MSAHNLPWTTDQYANVNDSQGEIVTVKGFALSGGPVCKANAEFIVRAANSHDALVAALIHIQQVACSGSPELGIATEALAALEAT